MMQFLRRIPMLKWLTPNIGIKRWMFLFIFGMMSMAVGIALVLLKLINVTRFIAIPNTLDWVIITLSIAFGSIITVFSLRRLMRNILAPYRRHQQGEVIDMVVQHSKLQRGFKYVAIGGGTGLPASLRGMKKYTSNITAVVTVADDGGSSGRLRRDMGIAPPGDLRNNIVALADSDSLLTRLFQYRFAEGDLKGHSFGNLFIAALAAVVAEESGNKANSLAEALVEAERVLNIQGRVLPATLGDVYLSATMQLSGTNRSIKVRGESQIEHVDGRIERLQLNPEDAEAYQPSVQAILDADLIVIGPGSLYTSILPNLLVSGIREALRASSAYKIYVCNVAMQPVETEGYTVADHVLALEQHIGRGVFQAVLANNCYPQENAGKNTKYVMHPGEHHEIHQRYEVRYTDLTDRERPWRHDPDKLAAEILQLSKQVIDVPTLANRRE
jgi:uncharacterized cofD-like protein